VTLERQHHHGRKLGREFGGSIFGIDPRVPWRSTEGAALGHDALSTIVYVGVARLPQPFVAHVQSLAVELELDLQERRITAASTNLQLRCLDRVLQQVAVGRRVDDMLGSGMLELEVRYSAPFAGALRVALQNALRRAAATSQREQVHEGELAATATRSGSDAREARTPGDFLGAPAFEGLTDREDRSHRDLEVSGKGVGRRSTSVID
jgi:hypothetical protein